MIDLNDASASLDLTLNVGSYFHLDPPQMRQIIKEVAKATSSWKTAASHLKIPKKEIERMASAFEHEDLKRAINL